MRVLFILFGVMLMSYFHFIVYIFGTILLVAAWKMAFGDDTPADLGKNPLIKFIGKKFNVLADYKGGKFFEKIDGKLYITHLFLTLIFIEFADLVFALDSIPAVIAITKDPFVIITSNIFAIMGLRALYFALVGFAELFVYLKYGIAFILVYVGLKMLCTDFIFIPAMVSLVLISFCIIVSIIMSVYMHKRINKQDETNKIELT